jgi:hypothetical protein
MELSTIKTNSAAVALAIIGDASDEYMFIGTQDVTLPMVWLDKWTIVFAVVLIAQIVSRKHSRKTEKDEDVDVATVA